MDYVLSFIKIRDQTLGRQVCLTMLSKLRCCQTKPNPSQSATITQIYEAQIWNHSLRAVVRFCL